MNRLYQIAFMLGVGVTALGFILGIAQSLLTTRGLPPLDSGYPKVIQQLAASVDDNPNVVEELRTAVRIDELANRPRHLFELVRASTQANNFEAQREAIEELRLLADAPAVPDRRVYYYLAVALMMQPDVEFREMAEALELAEHAVEIEPDSAQAHFALGQICSIMGRSRPGGISLRQLDQADFHLRKALELNPADIGAAAALTELTQFRLTLEGLQTQ